MRQTAFVTVMFALETLCALVILGLTFSVQIEMAEWEVQSNQRLFFALREIIYRPIPSFSVTPPC